MLLQKFLASIHELQSDLHKSQHPRIVNTIFTWFDKRKNAIQGTPHLRTNQLETLLLESLDDLSHQTALNAVGLDHDESSFAGHFCIPLRRVSVQEQRALTIKGIGANSRGKSWKRGALP
jgi:hypothetical protein